MAKTKAKAKAKAKSLQKKQFKIGFVGVGRMGANMARHLKDEGFKVTAVYDVNTAGAKALAKE